MNNPVENSEGENSPRRLHFKIPKEFYTSSDAEREAFIGEIYDQMLRQFQNSTEKKRKKNK